MLSDQKTARRAADAARKRGLPVISGPVPLGAWGGHEDGWTTYLVGADGLQEWNGQLVEAPAGSQLVSTAEAAELAGITAASFRREASRSPELQAARVQLDGRTPAYSRKAVGAWIASRPGRGRRTDLG